MREIPKNEKIPWRDSSGYFTLSQGVDKGFLGCYHVPRDLPADLLCLGEAFFVTYFAVSPKAESAPFCGKGPAAPAGNGGCMKQNKITDGVIWKQLLAFFFPIWLGMFFQQLYNTVDAVIVGNFAGKEALAAVGGPAGTIINLLVGFFMGLSSGATVIISQYYGGHRVEETSRAVHTAAALSIAGSVILTVGGLLLSPTILRWMGTPDDVIGHSVAYIQIYFCGTIFSMIYNIGSGILRAVGDSKRPLYFLIACSACNVVLDLLFVAVIPMGAAGAALATILSQAVSAVLVVLCLCKSTDIYRLELKKIRFDFAILKNMIRIGIPAGLQSVMYSLSNVIIQASINSFGTNAIAAWAAYGKIDGIFWLTISAFGTALTTFVGQNFGAQRYDRVKKSVHVCTAMAMGTTIVLSTLILLFGHYLYRLFISDEEVIAVGIQMMRYLVPFYFTYVLIETLAGALRGTGDAVIPMILTCLGVCVLRMIWIWVAVPIWPDIRTTCMSYPITWTITSVLFLIYYKWGGWMKRCARKAGHTEPTAG
jgi:putative MATE family efflux protein